MERTSCGSLPAVAATIFALAAPAAGATLSMSTDKATYALGESITLTVIGADAGEFALLLIVDVGWSPDLVAGETVVGTSVLPSPWQRQPDEGTCNGASGPDSCRAFSQSSGGIPSSIGGIAFATLQFVGVATGTLDFVFLPSTSWFGIGGGPGTSVAIVPEPEPAALLCLGLAGVALARRRR